MVVHVGHQLLPEQTMERGQVQLVKSMFGAPSMLFDIRTSRIHIAILFQDQQNTPLRAIL